MTHIVKKILLVDDEERLLNSMEQRLALMGFETIKASSGTKAIELAGITHPDLAIVDLKMPDMDGLTTITRLMEILPDLKTILLTGYGNEKTKERTESIGSGYFEKDSMDGLWDLIKHLNIENQSVIVRPSLSSTSSQPSDIIIKTNPNTNQQYSRSHVDSIGRSFGDLPKFIGETQKMQELRKQIERLSELNCTIIIQGETGTGKELAARAIHTLSRRRGQRFLSFNCNCFSNGFHFNELLMSLEEPVHASRESQNGQPENWGFTGTILLDNFEMMPEETQHQMIEIIDNKSLNKTSDEPETLLDIRFIVATHHNLDTIVNEGKINKSLYSRLNAIQMSVPSLRERREDISPLCSYFLGQLNNEFEKNIHSVSDEVYSIFMTYPFPGNVRELKHILERAVILSDQTTIELQHLPERFRRKVPVTPSDKNQKFLTLDEINNNHISKAMALTDGNKSKAAKLLGISRTALWRKLKLSNEE